MTIGQRKLIHDFMTKYRAKNHKNGYAILFMFNNTVVLMTISKV